jgi:hypothetical protein
MFLDSSNIRLAYNFGCFLNLSLVCPYFDFVARAILSQRSIWSAVQILIKFS